MILRALGATTALCFTLTAVVGVAALIALDFVGEDLLIEKLAGVVSPQPVAAAPVTSVEQLPALAGANDITFFTETAVTGLPYSVVTGVKFSTPANLAANIVAARWCYISAVADDGVGRKIELANQAGSEPPVFETLGDIPSEHLAAFRMGAVALEALARSHCRFDFTTPRKGSE